MKNKQKQFLAIFAVMTLCVILPYVAQAQIRFPDPLNADSPLEIYARIIKGLLGIVGIFALMNFTIAGIGIIYARGNQEKIKKHKDNMLWTILGIIFLFGAYSIIAYVLDALTGAAT